ncbi:MAG TPA: CocE/NonD family hydrolase [Solirubrobacteraceae bacterium]|nr:CocE/NonD family hydrolase [Solirubrobacteraceae bacterium]
MTLFSELLARRMHLVRPLSTDVLRERDLPVEMEDGVVLLADRWVPAAQASRPQPTVLVRSPYGRGQFVGLMFGRLLAERGLQVVVQSVRGTFGSGGTFAPFDERADGRATLRWLRAQPWHAGGVGTFGPSYLGLVQWAIAAEAPEDLVAMAIQVSASEFHSQSYPGGSISLETIASWMAILAVQESRVAPVRINRALRSLGQLFGEHPLVGLDEAATGAPVGWLREGFAQPGRDGDYWMRRDFSAAVPRVRAPVSFVGGWYDILLPWMLDDVVALQTAVPHRPPPRVIIGPWTHTSPELAAVGHREAIAFLRAGLLGDERLLRRRGGTPPVQLRLTGEGTVRREFASWPPPDAEPRRWFLAADGALAARAPELDRAGVDRYRYDPADPTPSFGGPVLMSREAVVDNRPLEARADVLTFTTEPLPALIESIGRPTVEVWARCAAPSFDIFARVCDVDEAGVSRNVCDALISVRADRDEPLEDGSLRLNIALWPLGHRFAAGHRIRLQISSGAYPRYARNPGTGEDPASAAPAGMRAVEVEILRDGAHPSSVTLPVMSPQPPGSAGDGDGD